MHGDVVRLRGLLTASNSRSGVRSCPLGSGALAGNPFRVDRHQLANDLGFDRGPTPNSLLGVGDRDAIADFLYWASMVMVSICRGGGGQGRTS